MKYPNVSVGVANPDRHRKSAKQPTMTTYFITRHSGAIAWATQQGICVDRQISHLDINDIQSGDTVIGSLPVNLAAEICQRGAAYIHMTLNVPEHWRGKE